VSAWGLCLLAREDWGEVEIDPWLIRRGESAGRSLIAFGGMLANEIGWFRLGGQAASTHDQMLSMANGGRPRRTMTFGLLISASCSRLRLASRRPAQGQNARPTRFDPSAAAGCRAGILGTPQTAALMSTADRPMLARDDPSGAPDTVAAPGQLVAAWCETPATFPRSTLKS
jgi:hypothetical protein